MTLLQPAKRQPRSRTVIARRIAVGIVRVFRPTSSVAPLQASEPRTIATTPAPASHIARFAASAETIARSSVVAERSSAETCKMTSARRFGVGAQASRAAQTTAFVGRHRASISEARRARSPHELAHAPPPRRCRNATKATPRNSFDHRRPSRQPRRTRAAAQAACVRSGRRGHRLRDLINKYAKFFPVHTFHIPSTQTSSRLGLSPKFKMTRALDPRLACARLGSMATQCRKRNQLAQEKRRAKSAENAPGVSLSPRRAR